MEHREKTSNRMQLLREEKGLNMKEAAALLRLPYTTYRNYEQGLREPNSEVLVQIANFYDVSVDYLIGRSQIRAVRSHKDAEASIPPGFAPMPEMVDVPIVGRIACGTPILAEQNIDGSACIPARWRATFSLVCKGDSMEPKIHDGDLVAIRKQPEVENGEIAAVRIGEEATLKRVYRRAGLLELRPENPDYESIILIGADMARATIEGKAVGLCRDI